VGFPAAPTTEKVAPAGASAYCFCFALLARPVERFSGAALAVASAAAAVNYYGVVVAGAGCC